jgi:hypothetical protein
VIQLACTPVVGLGLEGGLGHLRGPSVWTDSGAVSSCPLNESARSCLVETGPDQSSDVAYGLPAVSGAAFGAAEDLDWAPFGGGDSVCG